MALYVINLSNILSLNFLCFQVYNEENIWET